MLSFKQFIKKILFEDKKGTLVFIFGRMNPPTRGHEKLVSFAKGIADKEKAEFRFYVSHSQDKKKNPLSYTEKVEAIKQGMPQLGKYLIVSNLNTPFQVIEQDLNKFARIILIAGEDRADEFVKRMSRYPEVEVRTVDRGDGISATMMRNAVKNDDYTTFKKGLCSGFNDKSGKEFFQKLKSLLS